MGRAPFIWGQGGQQLTPEDVSRQRQVAQALLKSGADFSPATGGWAEALGRGFSGWASGRLGNLARESEAAGRESAGQKWQGLQSQIGGSTAPVIAPQGSGMAPSVGGADVSQAFSGSAAQGIREGLISRGLPPHVADAFVMNFQDESGLNPGINEAAPIVPGSRGGFGLAQWTGPRRRELESFAAQRGGDVADPNIQMDFLVTELQGPEAGAAQAILSAPTAEEAAVAVLNKFLRPAEQHRAEREARYLGGASPSGGSYMQPSAGNVSAIAEALADPWVAAQYGPVAEALMGQQMQMQSQAYQQQLAQQDPAYQIALQQAQLELQSMQNPADKVRYEFAPNGELVAINESQGTVNSMGGYAGQPDNPTSVDEYLFYANQAAQAGQQPLPYADWDIGRRQAGATSVNVGGEGGRNTEFEKTLGKGRADSILATQTAGREAQRKSVQLGQLEQALAGSPGGIEAVAKSWLGSRGIATEGLDRLQSAEALISQLVPAQRPPGSGTISDADLALYKASLPRLINTPEGNRLIMQGMRGIMEHDLAAGAIADMVIAGEISPDEGDKRMRELPNPLEGFDKAATQIGQAPGEMMTETVTVEEQAIPQAGQVVDGYRYNGGDPANPSSWERVR